MATCGRCQADLPGGASTCARCGAPVASVPSVPDLDLTPAPVGARPAPVPSPGAIDLSLGDELPPHPSMPPPLVLDIAPARQSVPPRDSAAPPPVAAQLAAVRAPAVSSMSGPDFDDDGPSVALEIATTAAPTPARSSGRVSTRPPPSGRVAVASDRPSGRTGKTLPPPEESDDPLQRLVPRADELRVDPYEVERLGAFGPPPEIWWEAPVYALRVRQRQLEMKEEINAARQTVKDTEKAMHEALVDALLDIVDRIEPSSPLGRAMATSNDVADRALRRRKAMADEVAAFRDEAAGIDKELKQLEASVTTLKAQRESLSGEAARLYTASKSMATPPPTLEDTRKRLADCERKLSDQSASIVDLKRQRKGLEEAHLARMDEAKRAFAMAEGEQRKALLAAGASAIHLLLAQNDPALGPFMSAQKNDRRARERLACVEQAAKAYDEKKVRQGLFMMFGVVGVIVLGILAGFIRMASG